MHKTYFRKRENSRYFVLWENGFLLRCLFVRYLHNVHVGVRPLVVQKTKPLL